MKELSFEEYQQMLTWNQVELVEGYINQSHFIDAHLIEFMNNERVTVAYMATAGLDLFTFDDFRSYVNEIDGPPPQFQFYLFESQVEFRQWFAKFFEDIKL